MFLYRKEASQVLKEIKRFMPSFEKDKMLDYTKGILPIIYDSIRYSDIKKLKNVCSRKVIDKLEKNKEVYRINDDIDRMVVQYSGLHDFIYRSDDEIYIQVYNSIYLHDNLLNNGPLSDELVEQIMSSNLKNKYWNDIWIVTFAKKKELVNKNTTCSNCGALMKYIEEKDMLSCEHCKNFKFLSLKNTDRWEIANIEKF